MSDATIVALVIMIGVFLTMIVTIIKSGPEAAIKMWGVMGALTGVAFGAITSFYFTTAANQNQIAALKLAKGELEYQLAEVDVRAGDIDLPTVALDANVESDSTAVAAEVAAEEQGGVIRSEFINAQLKKENAVLEVESIVPEVKERLDNN